MSAFNVVKTDNKYLTLLFLEDTDPISAESPSQILSTNLAFLISGLCNSSVSCQFIFTPDSAFLSKKNIYHTC